MKSLQVGFLVSLLVFGHNVRAENRAINAFYYTSDTALKGVNVVGRTTIAACYGIGNHLGTTHFTEHAKNAGVGAGLGAIIGGADFSEKVYATMAGTLVNVTSPIVRAACAEIKNEYDKTPEEITISNEAALAAGVGITLLTGLVLQNLILSYK